jgi:small-conductance mechanosensitive channel
MSNQKLISEIIVPATIVAGGLVLYQLIFFFLKKWARKERFLPGLLSRHIYFPGLFLMCCITLWVALHAIRRHMDETYYGYLHHVVLLLIITAVALLLMKSIAFFFELGLHHYKTENPLDYSLRKAKTKFQLIQRILNFIIILTAGAVMLITFRSIREIGSTLLASAGVVGLIIGFAAQKSLGTLFAGIQIAISQPIRIDDVVVVEGQFGTIGEITLTYVVVDTWDGRRLVVPINYFLEKSFENWTRQSPEVIAKVKIYADYFLPVEEIRENFLKWVEESPLWDGRKKGMVITDATSSSIEVRGIMSARNSDDAYELECQMRERLIGYIREKHPECLPSARIMITRDTPQSA